jgi:hypothetical protein
VEVKRVQRDESFKPHGHALFCRFICAYLSGFGGN